MVDLETYRARIGSFNHNGRYGRNTEYRSSPNSENVFTRWLSFFKSFKWTMNEEFITSPQLTTLRNRKIAVLLIVIIGFTGWIPNDDRYGKNRQRSGTNFNSFNYESESEKKTFNEIRTLVSKLHRSKSHLMFFLECQRKNLRPVNLEYNGNFNLSFSDNFIISKLNAVDNNNNTEKILICINHFRLQSNILEEKYA